LALGLIRSPAPRWKSIARGVSVWRHRLFRRTGEAVAAGAGSAESTGATLASLFRSSRLFAVPAIVPGHPRQCEISISGPRSIPSYFTDDLLPPITSSWHSAYIGLQLHPLWPERIPRKELAGQWGDEAPFTLSRLLLMGEAGYLTRAGAAGTGFRARLHDG
jgi:hypothetical protein